MESQALQANSHKRKWSGDFSYDETDDIMEISPVESLPFEIIAMIFENLKKKDLAAVTGTCKTFRGCVLRDEDFVLNPTYAKMFDFSLTPDNPISNKDLHRAIQIYIEKKGKRNCIGIAMTTDRVLVVTKHEFSYGLAEFIETFIAAFSKKEGAFIKKKCLNSCKHVAVNTVPTQVAYDSASDSLAIAFQADSGRVYDSELNLKFIFNQPLDRSFHKNFHIYHPVDVFKIEQNKIIAGLRNSQIMIWDLADGKLESIIDRNLKSETSPTNKNYRTLTLERFKKGCFINPGRHLYEGISTIAIRNIEDFMKRTIQGLAIKGNFIVAHTTDVDNRYQEEIWDARTGNLVHLRRKI